MSRRPVLVALRGPGLGALLTGLPALRALGDAFPDHDRVLVGPASLAPLLELADTGFRVVEAEGLGRSVPPTSRPDVAVNLHGRGPESHRRLQSLRPGRLVAFEHPAVPHEGPEWRWNEHEVARWCRLLREGLLAPADPRRLRLRAPPGDGSGQGAGGKVLVHPGAAHRARQWPPERFGAVAATLVADGHGVVVTGSAQEVGIARVVARTAGLAADAVLAGDTDLLGMAARVAEARLVVCGDTGLAHLASAFDTPSVVLFGPTPPSWWGPPPDGPHRVIWRGTGPADPWADEVDPALDEISVDEVVAAARDLLGTGPGVRYTSTTGWCPPLPRTIAASG